MPVGKGGEPLKEQAVYNRLEEMIESWIHEEHEPDELHQCPECGGQFHIQFEVYRRGEKRLLGVQTWCEDCQIAMALDFAEPIPAWAKSKKVQNR